MARMARLRQLRYGAFARVRRRGKVLDWLAARVTALTGTGATSTFTATASVAATGTLTLAANAANGDQVVIGTRTYQFQTALAALDHPLIGVLIGATASDSIDNLIAAVNLAAGEGTTYGAGQSTAHPTVTVAAGAGDTMDVTAREKGLVGNSIATTETGANMSWGSATLTGGLDPTFADTGHGFVTGEHPVQVSNSGGALPAGLAASTVYWPIYVDANTFKLATSREAARAGAHVHVTGAGTGTHSVFRPAEANADIHGWLKAAKAEQLNAASDIDSIVSTQ